VKNTKSKKELRREKMSKEKRDYAKKVSQYKTKKLEDKLRSALGDLELKKLEIKDLKEQREYICKNICPMNIQCKQEDIPICTKDMYEEKGLIGDSVTIYTPGIMESKQIVTTSNFTVTNDIWNKPWKRSGRHG